MKLKFFVIGACYSGYMFKEKLLGNLANGNIEMVYQHQHDTFVSMMTKPLEMDLTGATSKYQWDFNHFAESIFKKDMLTKIKQMKPDYIVLDVTSEDICPIIQIDEETYITLNYYIRTSSIYEKLKNGREIPVGTEERYELFKTYAIKFFEAVRLVLPDVKFILTKTRACQELYNPLLRERSMFEYYSKVERQNELRRRHEEFILQNISDIRCLSMVDEYNVADTLIKNNYNYDISHNHFAVDFYRRQYHKLQDIVIADMLGGREKTRYFNQAVCIMATDDFPMLLLQAKIYKDFFRVYINIDIGSIGNVFTEEQILRLRKVPNVFVLAKYPSPKGSYNELLAMLEISEMAFDNPDVSYIHYTTSNDMPIRPINAIYQYFEKSANQNSFLNNHADGNRAEMKKVAEYTYKYYHYFYNGDENDRNVKQMSDESIRHQKSVGIARNTIGEFKEMYKGVIGGSLTREAYEYCMNYSKAHPEYMKDIKFIRLRTEFFFHTILLNTPSMKDKLVSGIRGGKHDWLWDFTKQDYMELQISDYRKLKSNTNTLFVRKISSKNKELIQELLKDIKTPYTLEE